MRRPAVFSMKRLRAGVKPFRLHWFARLRSTNDHAAALRRAGKLFAPAIVLAQRQTAGRGRGKNTWWSGAGARGGALTITFVLPIRERLAAQELPLIAGLAVRHVAAKLTGNDDIQVKWPNDLLYRGQKLAGLLCERVDKADLIGIGLNVNINPAMAPTNLRKRITSMRDLSAKSFDMTEVVVCLAEQLSVMMRRRIEQPFSVFLRDFRKHDALAGKSVTVVPGGSESAMRGKYLGVDDHGRLLLGRGRKILRIVAGQIISG